MNKSKLLVALLMSMSCSVIQSDDSSTCKNFMKSVTENLRKSTRSASDWAIYYSHICTHKLSDWIEYCRCSGKDNAQAFAEFMVDENDIAFKKLSRAQKRAIKDLNTFHAKMAAANEVEQKALVEEFLNRWEEFKEIFSDQTINKNN